MVIKIIALGKLKEKYFSDAYREYEKRLGAFCRIITEEIEPSKLPDEPSEAQINKALAAEAEKIRQKLTPGSLTAALCVEGEMTDSKGLAERIRKAAVSGKSGIDLIIGSSFGLSEEIKRCADIKLSMSPMTFPHQLARIMLIEQIYRSFTIINNRKYHK